MVNGRAKGKRGEREVARLLEEYWGRLEPGCKFKSTPLSGGWSSPDVREAFKTSGDLVTTAKLFPYVVEVKLRESWSLKNLVEGKPCPVWGWWEQAIKAAKEQKGIPMLWFRKNRWPWRIMIPESFFIRLGKLPVEIEWKQKLPTDWQPLVILASDFLKDGPND
ncbi:MAG: hypothetical protein KGL39_18190 [Patescibacteria group bacterium]|nr:hypothetical protein [Patescibacteria group bacterium]